MSKRNGTESTEKMSHTLGADTKWRIEKVADDEGRSRSNMIDRLLIEALDARGVPFPKSNDHTHAPGRPVAPDRSDPSESNDSTAITESVKGES